MSSSLFFEILSDAFGRSGLVLPREIYFFGVLPFLEQPVHRELLVAALKRKFEVKWHEWLFNVAALKRYMRT